MAVPRSIRCQEAQTIGWILYLAVPGMVVRAIDTADGMTLGEALSRARCVQTRRFGCEDEDVLLMENETCARAVSRVDDEKVC